MSSPLLDPNRTQSFELREPFTERPRLLSHFFFDSAAFPLKATLQLCATTRNIETFEVDTLEKYRGVDSFPPGLARSLCGIGHWGMLPLKKSVSLYVPAIWRSKPVLYSVKYFFFFFSLFLVHQPIKTLHCAVWQVPSHSKSFGGWVHLSTGSKRGPVCLNGTITYSMKCNF